MRILVTGATGYIGGRLVPRLVAAGHRVVCLARDPQRLVGRWRERVEIQQGDVLDPVSLGPALDGVDVAYYLVHCMAGRAPNYAERDRMGAEHFGAAARAAHVQRIVYLGGLGADDKRLSPHLASRHQVGKVLRASGVPVTEFRAAVVVGSGSISFEMIRYLTERLPLILTSRWVTTRCQPIAIGNVLDYLVRCLGEPRSIGRTLEIGGPDVLTYRDMIRGYAAARGLTRCLVSIPVLTPRLCSQWVGLVTPIPAAYAHPLIEGLRNEVVVRDLSAHEIFNIDLIPYAEAVRRATERTRLGEVETSWAGARAGLAPGVTLRATEGLIFEERRVESAARPASVYAVFASIGGEHGWYYANWLWQLRGLLDRLIGGVGMRRGRRSPDDLRPGDALDFWRVETVDPGRLVRLRAEMGLPGFAWLQFEARPRPGGGTLLIQTAFFEPHGLSGFAYWHALYPLHQLIFSGLARAVARKAATAPLSMNVRSPDFHRGVISVLHTRGVKRAVAVALLVIVALALRAQGRPASPTIVRTQPVGILNSAEGRGRLVYERYGCRMCHGDDGKGGMANPNAMTEGKVPGVIIDYVGEGYTVAELKRLILNGAPRIDREDPKGPVPPYRMPGWNGQISSQDLEDLVRYLLSLVPKSTDKGWR